MGGKAKNNDYLALYRGRSPTEQLQLKRRDSSLLPIKDARWLPRPVLFPWPPSEKWFCFRLRGQRDWVKGFPGSLVSHP